VHSTLPLDFDLAPSDLPDDAAPAPFGRVAHDRRELPVVYGHDGQAALLGARPHTSERVAVENEGLLADDVPAAIEGGEHRLLMHGGRRADVDEVERFLGRETVERLVGPHRWREARRRLAPLRRAIDDGG